MKIQCSCGAKYEIEVAPGMQPVQFVCANCGLDSSDFVNALIRKELDAPNPPVPAPPPPEPSPRRLRISTTRPASPAESPSPEAEQPESLFCARHQELAVERCVVCKKPICPKCMELFGCVCSPFCKARAVAQKTNVPIYAGQAFLAEARYWKKTGAIFAVVGLMLAGILGAWAWYAWFGSVPRVVFSIPFRNAAYAGGSYLANDQIVILHGGALARYDLKTGQKVWSRQLISAQAISDVAQRENAAAARESAMNPNENTPAELPSVVLQNARAALEGQFTLHASGHDVWTAAANVLTHYDWDTGRTLQKITLTNRYGEWVQQGDELQAIHAAASGAQTIARLDMAGGQLQTETVPGWTGQMPPASAGSPGGGASGGLPVSAGAPARPLNPQTVSRQAQHLTLPARLALPALLANSEHEQQLEQALNGGAPGVPQKPAAPPPSMGFTVIPDGANYVEFSSTLIKPHFVEQEAIQSAPEKSALDNPNLNSSDTS
ncbi:MAG: hypothetical protein KGR98_07375, partial [Verrucomicrobia bacterium]|nr:hypothetical protein [Verrucomicrobiota bacterium]